MKKIFIVPFALMVIAIVLFNACKKSVETIYISPAIVYAANPISDTTTGGTLAGTMLNGHTYNISRDITVNKGDTLWLQAGVTVCLHGTPTIIIKGAMISLGTQASPNWFTRCSLSKTNTVAQSENPVTDSAFIGCWTGINCDTSCTLLVLKWTHIEWAGAAFPVTENFVGGTQGKRSYAILFQNPSGDFVMEDSWIYGSTDDAIRVQSGRISLMRNTFEKCGATGGDCVNIKSGSVGDIAYNLYIGTATNGSKASNKGGINPQCNINIYNNTYIDGGYRQYQTGRGANVNYEQGARGLSYNNLIVNCKFGFRIVGNPTYADTLNMGYGYNYAYGDSASIVDQFIPVGYVTKNNAYVIPSATTLNQIPVIYDPVNGTPVYNAASLAGQNNPLFVNFPLPETGISHLYDINYISPGTIAPLTSNPAGSYDFHLQVSSPAIGIGYINFSALNMISAGVKASSFAPIITPPSPDMGCYPFLGGGNQH